MSSNEDQTEKINILKQEKNKYIEDKESLKNAKDSLTKALNGLSFIKTDQVGKNQDKAQRSSNFSDIFYTKLELSSTYFEVSIPFRITLINNYIKKCEDEITAINIQIDELS